MDNFNGRQRTNVLLKTGVAIKFKRTLVFIIVSSVSVHGFQFQIQIRSMIEVSDV